MKSPISMEFSDQDLQDLEAWLMRRGKGIDDIVELEGFLTAIIIGPNTLHPMRWLPKVWGGKAPEFKDLEEMNRFIGLVMGYHNDLVGWFEYEPERFKPTFYERVVDGKRYRIVDEWCLGFMKGLRLDAAGWKPLKRERPDLLRPLELFGTRAGWREMAAGDDAVMHKKWSPKITPAVRAIHQFWVPHRIARHRTAIGEKTH